MSYRFFVSYGTLKHQHQMVLEFFDKLEAKVAELIGPNGDLPGYIDRKGTDAGTDWNQEIADGLRTSKALIILMSEHFLASGYCAKELEAFRQRVAAAGFERDGLIIPVRWSPLRRPKELPEPLANLSYGRDGFPDTYARDETSLTRLLSGNLVGDYEKVIDTLADLIVKKTEATPLSDSALLPDLRTVTPAFQQGSLGPRNVRFVYVAPGQNELPPARTHRDPYEHDGGPWWYPYRPPKNEAIGEVAIEVARSLNPPMHPSDLEAEPGLVERIRNAFAKNTPVAVFVDPWALELPRYSELMRGVDPLAASCMVFVAWNNDENTMAHEDHLLDLVRETFRDRRLSSREEYFQERVPSLEDLRARLSESLEWTRSMFVERAKLIDRPRFDAVPFPNLKVPGKSSSGPAGDGGDKPV